MTSFPQGSYNAIALKVKGGKLPLYVFARQCTLVVMKTHIAAIGHNERELETYVGQLKTQGFESIGEAKKAEDGTYYQAMSKGAKVDLTQPEKTIAATALTA